MKPRLYLLLSLSLLSACRSGQLLTSPRPDDPTAQAEDTTKFKRDSPFKSLAAQPSLLTGSAGRQYRKNLKAEAKLEAAKKPAVPKKLAKGAVYAPNAAAPVSASYKPTAPVLVGDSSTLNAVLGGGALAAVQGDGNHINQEPTTEQYSGWHALLTGPVGYVGATLLAAGVVGIGLWAVVAYRRRRAAAKVVATATKIIG